MARRRRLVTSGEAGDELGVDRATLVRWWHEGRLRPAFVTLGRHARWDMDDLRRQIDAQLARDDETPDS